MMNYKLSSETENFLKRHHMHLINGLWKKSSDGTEMQVTNPATKIAISKVPIAGKREVDEACVAARQSFDDGVWANMSPASRGKILWLWADILEKQKKQIAEVEVLDNGMPMAVAETFIGWAIDWIRYYAGMPDKLSGENLSGPTSGDGNAFHSYTSFEPVGAVGIIIPWNGPFGTFIIKVAPALAAGCSCVVKPAEDTPLTALILAEAGLEAGIPPGVLNVISGGSDIGKQLVANKHLDKISFTGSTEVGKEIVRVCAHDLKRVTLELGGKSPCIVLDDADLDLAIPGAAMAIFSNSGQVCFAGSRLLIQEKVYEEVLEGVARFAEGLKVGDGFDPETSIGPLISQAQLTRVASYVERGKNEGAVLLTGGKEHKNKGFFFEPTVFGNVSEDMAISTDEIFGPVLSTYRFSTLQDALDVANNTRYGLGAGIFTSNVNTAHKLAAGLKTGNVWVNHYGGMHSALPFGGYKESGWGRELGKDGLKTYLEKKTVSIKLS